MRRRDGHHRKVGAWRPNQRQERVLDLLVEGRTNPEIATALGITIDGAKWHIGEMLLETGLSDRFALGLWWIEERQKRRARLLVPAPPVLAMCLAAFLIVSLLLLTFGRGNEAPGLTPEPTLEYRIAWDESPKAATCEPPEGHGFRIVDQAELLAQGLVPAGRLIELRDCPLLVSNRVDRSVAWTSGPLRLQTRELVGGKFVGADEVSPKLKFQVGPDEYDLEAWASPGTAQEFRFRYSNDSVATLSTETGSFLIFLAGLDGRAHRSALSSDGMLFVAPDSLRDDVLYNPQTGELIDADELAPIALRMSGTSMFCVVADTCWVLSETGTIRLPFGGRLTCSLVSGQITGYRLSSDVIAETRLLSPGIVFVIRNGRLNSTSSPECREVEVPPGFELPVGEGNLAEVTAFSLTGEKLSLATSLDGTIYVGRLELRYDCPCVRPLEWP